MSLALLGLGLGWNVSYVAATTELVSLTAPSERGRLVGFSDLCASFVAAGLALLGGLVYSGAGVTALALARPPSPPALPSGSPPGRSPPPLAVAVRRFFATIPRRRTPCPPLFCDEDLFRQTR